MGVSVTRTQHTSHLVGRLMTLLRSSRMIQHKNGDYLFQQIVENLGKKLS